MLYEQKCTQPGKQTAKTTTVHVFTELHTLHHFDYSAVTHTKRLLQWMVIVRMCGYTFFREDVSRRQSG